MRFLTQLIQRLHFWRISGLLLADFMLFGATNPQDTPSFVLIIGFVLMAVTLYYLLDGALAFVKLYGVPVRHKRRLLRSLTLLISGVIAFQSIGQLSLRDVVVLSPLTVLLYAYVAYLKSSRRQLAARQTES